jgi:hypothetical protein
MAMTTDRTKIVSLYIAGRVYKRMQELTVPYSCSYLLQVVACGVLTFGNGR